MFGHLQPLGNFEVEPTLISHICEAEVVSDGLGYHYELRSSDDIFISHLAPDLSGTKLLWSGIPKPKEFHNAH